jgi:anti-sigma-K factor RskA
MNDPQQIADRLRDLLADQALFELLPEEQAELRALLAESTVNPESFEWTAALASVALNPGPYEPLPAELRAKIAAAAPEHQAAAQLVDENKRLAGRAGFSTRASKHGIRFREALAWFATAACLFVAMMLWSASHPPTQSIAQARAALLEQEPKLKPLAWTATEDPAAKGATGDVVWSKDKQQGFMRFKGLAKNDPSQNQYQLWIFDANQDERYPIDGGVFDVDPTTGDVIVPIHAKLQVVDPKMFAVTVEKPGGVVVSDRKHIAVLAKAD